MKSNVNIGAGRGWLHRLVDVDAATHMSIAAMVISVVSLLLSLAARWHDYVENSKPAQTPQAIEARR